MTLPANSTFLPILDDLLSPDFRPVLLPAQTPQTPAANSTFCTVNVYGNLVNLNKTQKDESSNNTTSDSEAAQKIQNWWKSKRSNSFDVKAERIKHSIRHSRTEDHIRYLETEVSRLKSALSSERKIRSLQLEAIRSLWSQVQRISTVDPSSSLMTRSVPNMNGLPKDPKHIEAGGGGEHEKNIMSMSMNAALENPPISLQSVNLPSCSCTKEVQNLRESLTQEMSQLRAMIDQLTNSRGEGRKKDGGAKSATGTTEVIIISEQDVSTTNSNTSQTQETEEGEAGHSKGDSGDSDNNGKQHAHKRPFSLNLTGISSHATTTTAAAATANGSSPESQEKKTTEEEKEQIVDYANQMASKLVDDAIVEDEVNE